MTVTRFPPSPTGYLHIGGARTALYSWLHAKQNNGKFILRIEDTDLERSTQESVQAILDGMQWLGLDYDEGPYYQTKRFDRYKEVVQQLLDSGHAYYCYCTREEVDEMREQQRAKGEKPRYDGRWRNRTGSVEGVNPVVRFKNPLEGDVIIEDLVKGNIVINNRELDDLIIARADGVPTYNLTVVVDDLDMNMTHVIRGDDHINNTPRQMNIMRALNADESGKELPKFAHVPMILGEDGKRLSKRHGAVSVMHYRDQGYLPEALLNYLARLGWSHGDKELFTREELLELFRIEDVNRAASTFNAEKLLWINHETIKSLSANELIEKAQWHFEQQGITIAKEPLAEPAIELVKERTKTLLELVEQTKFFFNDVEEYDPAALKKWVKTATPDILNEVFSRLESLSEWTAENLHHVVQSTVDDLELGFAKVAQPIRIAVTGGTQSPAIDLTLLVLGREMTLERVQQSIEGFQKVLQARQT